MLVSLKENLIAFVKRLLITELTRDVSSAIICKSFSMLILISIFFLTILFSKIHNEECAANKRLTGDNSISTLL